MRSGGTNSESKARGERATMSVGYLQEGRRRLYAKICVRAILDLAKEIRKRTPHSEVATEARTFLEKEFEIGDIDERTLEFYEAYKEVRGAKRPKQDQ